MPAPRGGGGFGRSSWPLLVNARVPRGDGLGWQSAAGAGPRARGGAVGRNADFVSLASTLRCCEGFCFTTERLGEWAVTRDVTRGGGGGDSTCFPSRCRVSALQHGFDKAPSNFAAYLVIHKKHAVIHYRLDSVCFSQKKTLP